MTRRRKTLLVVVVVVVVLAAAGLAWYRQATAVDRQINALLAEVRNGELGLVERWLIKLGLGNGRRSDRSYDQVACDLAKLGPSAVPRLVRALGDSDCWVRCAAARALGDLGDTRAVGSLTAVLQEADVRQSGVGPLGQIRSPSGGGLMWYMTDEDEGLWLEAAWALAKLGERRGVDFLIGSLKREEACVRYFALQALGELRDVRAVAPLIGALKDEMATLRAEAARRLGKLGDPRAVEPLEELLGDEEPVVREAATEAIKQLRRQSEGKP